MICVEVMARNEHITSVVKSFTIVTVVASAYLMQARAAALKVM